LGCAWNLRDCCEVTLFEQDKRPGGHTNTVEAEEDGAMLPIDTGFIVFNKVTYPHLCKLFEELKVLIKPSEMSFSVQHFPARIEYNGMGLRKVFSQPRNLFRPRFHAFLGKIQHFFGVANELVSTGRSSQMTLREFVAEHDLGQDFLDWYLVPMSSAVWSTEPGDVLDFPTGTLIHFFHNHGFLGVDTHHPWFTVDGGARTYVRKILAEVGAPRLAAKVVEVREVRDECIITTEEGDRLSFDRVIIAAHADQALGMLPSPDADQQRLLAPFRYQRNDAILHSDRGVMPKRRIAWASWNYRVTGTGDETRATTHYWMNALQNVSKKRDYFVSLNSDDLVDPERVIYRTTYEHPVFSAPAVAAQDELPKLNDRSPSQRVYFCGSYFKYGFHEDAYASAVRLCETLRSHLCALRPA
jgi:predicted NAD/FAD-binding protein